MYLAFFGLNEKPFSITPDPRYLFLSERHAEALAHLLYGVSEAGGFVQLTGEVGTGKTTIVRSLLGQVPKNAEVALILNPRITAPEFMLSICEELGIGLPDKAEGSLKYLVDVLNHYLLRAHADGRRVVLMVDEAQNLAPAVLEQVRLLTNLETPTQKLLQIILIGQPELRELLSRPELRQLAQRITGRYHLDPLSRAESSAYVLHRLRVAGATTDIFTAGSLAEIYRHSGGIPRLINVICDRALLGAYTRDQHRVTAAIVRNAASEVLGHPIAPRWLPWVAGAATCMLVVLGVGAAWRMGLFERAPATPGVGTAQAATGGDAADEADDGTAAGVAPTGADASAIGAGGAGASASASPPEPATVPLATLLAPQATATNDDEAFTRLFARWGATYRPREGDGCVQAIDAGLDCIAQRGSFAQLRLYNRPAILMLSDGEGGARQVLLSGLGDDTARLDVGGAEHEVKVSDLAKYWFGDFVLLWRPVAVPVKVLVPGMRGDEVRWLRESLARLAGQPSGSPVSDQFDDSLVQLVEAFQREHRLTIDGIAGLQTQLAIDAALPASGTPVLSATAPLPVNIAQGG